MSFEIAQAFVRIRPNTEGFQSETTKSVKGAFSGIAKTIGVIAGATGAFELFKNSVEDAAGVQKSMEVISSEFGKGGAAVKKFADDTAVSLGITTHTAASTAAQFGLLFHNLGIGKAPAAEMTVNLEKLAGSISEIRGIDPSTVLAQLPRAMLGNLRSLKQLGFAFSNTQIQAAAFEVEGVKIGAALTPAQKAVAIYSLVTQNLGEYQKQAAAHSGDLVNVQRRLSAEWDKAKESLGTALLPALTQAASALSDFLDKENKSGALTRDFGAAVAVISSAVKIVAQVIGAAYKAFGALSDAVGGTKRAVEVLLIAFAVSKFKGIAQSITDDLVKKGILTIGPAAAKAGASAGQLSVSYGEASTSIVGSLDKVGAAIEALVKETQGAGASASPAAAEISSSFAAASTSISTSAGKAKFSLGQLGPTVTASAAEIKTAATGLATPFTAASTEISGAFTATVGEIESGATKIRFAFSTIGPAAAQASAMTKTAAEGIAAPYVAAAGEIKAAFAEIGTSVTTSTVGSASPFAMLGPEADAAVGQVKAAASGMSAPFQVAFKEIVAGFALTVSDIEKGSSAIRVSISEIGPVAVETAGKIRASATGIATPFLTAAREIEAAFANLDATLASESAKAGTSFAEIGPDAEGAAGSIKAAAVGVAAPWAEAAGQIRTAFGTTFGDVSADASTAADSVKASAAGIAAPYTAAAAEIKGAFAGTAAQIGTDLDAAAAKSKGAALGIAVPMEAAATEISTSFTAATSKVVANVALYTGAVRTMPVTAATAAGETEVATTAMSFSFAAMATSIKASLISTGIGAIPVLIGILVVEVIQHFNTVKGWFISFGGWIKDHASEIFFVPIIGPIIFMVVEVIKHFGELKNFVSGVGTFFSTVFTHPIRAIETAVGNMVNWIKEQFGGMLQAIGDLLSKIPSWLPGIGKFHKWGEQLQAYGVQIGSTTGTNIGTNIDVALTHQMALIAEKFKPGGAFANAISNPLDNAVIAVDKANQAAAHPTKPKKTTGISSPAEVNAYIASQAAITKKIRNANQAAAAAAAALRQANADRLAATRASAAAAAQAAQTAAQEAADAVKAANEKIANVVASANTNLSKLGAQLAAMVGKFMDKNTALGVGGLQSTTAAFKKLKAQIASGDTTGIGKASATLQSQLSGEQAGQGALAKRKAAVVQRIADLIDEFKKHAITLKQLNSGIATELASQGINYKNAGKVLGIAFADGYLAQIKALKKQAVLVLAGDKLLPKGKGGTQGVPGGPKVVDPVKVAADARHAAELRRERAHATELRQQAAAARSRAVADRKAANAAKKAAKARAKQVAVLGSIHGKLTGPGKGPKGGKGNAATTSSTYGLGY